MHSRLISSKKGANESMRWPKLLLVAAIALSLNATPAANKKDGKTPAATSGASKVDLKDTNNAGAARLVTLPGIAAAYTSTIISGRLYNGEEQLVQKKTISVSTYTKMNDRIITE